MSWNPVLNFFKTIKNRMIERNFPLWDYENYCITYWVNQVGTEEEKEIISNLIFTEYKNFLLVHYGNFNKIDITKEFWDSYDGFYKECRSVVIDIKKDQLVLTPFKKFFNINEREETAYNHIKTLINNGSFIEFSEKLDGSMQSARYYEGEYIMSGSQALDPEQSWRLTDGYRLLKENYKEMLKNNPDDTFIFEYISPNNPHVVEYKEEKLSLTGIRNVITGKEVNYQQVIEMAKQYDIPTVNLYQKTLDEVMNSLDEKEAIEAEGFVLNIDGYKVKIKYNDYVFMHKALASLVSPKTIFQAIADDKYDDFYSKVPSAYRGRIESIANFIFDYVKKMEEETEKFFTVAPKENKKEFMIWVEKNVPQNLKGLVRNKYLGKEVNILKMNHAYQYMMQEKNDI